MIRDKGPIHNIGFGLTSREFSPGDNEQQGTSPQSGFIARALEGRPIVKAATALVATGIAATYAGKMLRGGGLKLRKTNSFSCSRSSGRRISNKSQF